MMTEAVDWFRPYVPPGLELASFTHWLDDNELLGEALFDVATRIDHDGFFTFDANITYDDRDRARGFLAGRMSLTLSQSLHNFPIPTNTKSLEIKPNVKVEQGQVPKTKKQNQQAKLGKRKERNAGPENVPAKQGPVLCTEHTWELIPRMKLAQKMFVRQAELQVNIAPLHYLITDNGETDIMAYCANLIKALRWQGKPWWYCPRILAGPCDIN
ncbi:hypothetical protein HDK90DRAFT_523457 [Phyllosticta capitalensis]|uniref:Uncharacterized protein n=1 Tax=Phyllosticta capitalensis TaxID=121624 RepID=A0ABR1YW28_9PEZI